MPVTAWPPTTERVRTGATSTDVTSDASTKVSGSVVAPAPAVAPFDDALDFRAFVRDVLAGKSGVPARPDDPMPVAWLDRVYPRLASTPYADKLGHAVADALSDADPSVRLQALMFFEHNPTAPGGDRVIAFARNRHAHFHGVPNPEHPDVDLGWQLLTTLGSLVRKDVGEAKTAAHAIVLQPGRAAPLIGSLSKVDPDWVSKHAEEIVRATTLSITARFSSRRTML